MDDNSMDISAALGLAGLLATIVFGILGVMLVRSRKYPGNLTFVYERTISLFDEIVRNLSGISVLYQSQPVSETLVLVSGYLMNTGSKDISPEMISQPLRAILPEGYRWLEARVVSASPGVDASVAASSNVLEFNLGLFRSNEFLRVEALVEAHPAASATVNPDGQTLSTVIMFSHRIADTARLQVQPLLPHGATLSNRIPLVAMSLLLAITFSYYILSTSHGWVDVLFVALIWVSPIVLFTQITRQIQRERRLRRAIGYSPGALARLSANRSLQRPLSGHSPRQRR